jgi:hypothetical protein
MSGSGKEHDIESVNGEAGTSVLEVARRQFGKFVTLFGSAAAVATFLVFAGFLSEFALYRFASLPRRAQTADRKDSTDQYRRRLSTRGPTRRDEPSARHLGQDHEVLGARHLLQVQVDALAAYLPRRFADPQLAMDHRRSACNGLELAALRTIEKAIAEQFLEGLRRLADDNQYLSLGACVGAMSSLGMDAVHHRKFLRDLVLSKPNKGQDRVAQIAQRKRRPRPRSIWKTYLPSGSFRTCAAVWMMPRRPGPACIA